MHHFSTAFLALVLSPALYAGTPGFAGWEIFTCPDTTCAPNVPDMGGATNTDATIVQLVSGAILTSGGNIYHPFAASYFVLADSSTAPLQTVSLFLKTDGVPLDSSSVVLKFGTESRSPTISGGSGLWTFDWDLGGNSVQSYTIEWQATSAHMSLDRAELTTDAGDSLGTNYCTSVSNSTGFAATIEANGSAVIAHDDLHFLATGVPSQPGIFFSGVNAAQLPFGNGFMCTTGNILRGHVVVGSELTAQYQWHTSNLVPGTRYFQYWYRDPMGGGAGFNTSDGVEILLL